MSEKGLMILLMFKVGGVRGKDMQKLICLAAHKTTIMILVICSHKQINLTTVLKKLQL